MDQLVSQLLPTQRIGNDGFLWWVGQIEGTASDEENNKGGYRFKVRIVGDHPGDPELVGTDDLPWANVMMPVTVPFIPGNAGGAHPQLEIGCWVVGFYMDTEKQKPIIMGSIGQTPGATKVFVERTPDTPPFTTAIPQLNGAKDGPPKQKGSEKNTATGGLTDGTKDGQGNLRVGVSEDLTAPLENETQQSENWCQSKAEKCDEDDMMSQMTGIMGEFLAAVQNNGGNIGTALVNKTTGGLMDGVNLARGYVNKAMAVVNEFVAKVKGFIIEKLTAAVKDLIKALLHPSETGNALTPVTEFFNNLLKQLGCSMADLGDRLAEWLTDLLMSYVEQIYKSVACQIDALVNGIMSKINSLMNELLDSILGPLNDILGAIAAPLNILGGAINFVLNLLGISCSGPDRSCSKKKQICTNGAEKLDKEGDFLDDLLAKINNRFSSTGADYTQYVCGDAYKGTTLDFTTVGFTGGIPAIPGISGNIPDVDKINNTTDNPEDNNGVKQVKRITYDIADIKVEEGDIAQFVVKRSGYTEVSSSVTYKTLKHKGTAKENEDYLPVNDILGFAPGETEKTISVRTITSAERESDEDFYLILKKNTPSNGSKVQTVFVKNVAICTITEGRVKEPYNPWRGPTKNPFDDLEEVFNSDLIGTIDDDLDDTQQVDSDSDGDGLDDNTGEDIVKVINVVADRQTCPEGEFITYTITSSNVENGSIYYYTLSGNGITSEDIIGGNITGNFVINSNTAKVVVGIEDDGVVEDDEVLRFTINGTGAFVDVIIITDDDDFDQGYGDSPRTDTTEFRVPTVDENNIITDDNGGIIDIPIDNPGDPWAEPPYVFITGQGIGATATALLDQDGYLTEIRIKSSGYGYKKNLASDRGKRCIIDAYTVSRPGIGYTEKPTIYVNGRTDIAEAIINDDGFVIGARTLDRVTTYDKFPEIIIVGGGGYGAKLLPSLVCLDEQNLTKVGSTKIGTGKYIDCP
jgi:hypothetical protein